jgi:hypothetical protein
MRQSVYLSTPLPCGTPSTSPFGIATRRPAHARRCHPTLAPPPLGIPSSAHTALLSLPPPFSIDTLRYKAYEMPHADLRLMSLDDLTLMSIREVFADEEAR